MRARARKSSISASKRVWHVPCNKRRHVNVLSSATHLSYADAPVPQTRGERSLAGTSSSANTSSSAGTSSSASTSSSAGGDFLSAFQEQCSNSKFSATCGTQPPAKQNQTRTGMDSLPQQLLARTQNTANMQVQNSAGIDDGAAGVINTGKTDVDATTAPNAQPAARDNTSQPVAVKTDSQQAFSKPPVGKTADQDSAQMPVSAEPPRPNGDSQKAASDNQPQSSDSGTKNQAPTKSTKTAPSDNERRANDDADSVTLSASANAAAAGVLPIEIPDVPAQPDRSSAPVPASKNAASAPEPVQASQSTTAVSVMAQPVFGDLALALRIQSPRANANADTESASPNPTPASSAGPLLSAAPQSAQPTPERKLDSQISALIAPSANEDHRASSATQPVSHTESAAPASTPSDFEAELNKFRAAEPVRGAQVQISGADSQRVDIRLVERAGTLSVTVRSSDTTLARSLEQHAPELNTTLHLEHFRTEMWTPSANRGSFQSQSGNQPGSSYSSNSGNNSQQQNRKQQQQPEWIDEMESHSATLQKRIEYTWQ